MVQAHSYKSITKEVIGLKHCDFNSVMGAYKLAPLIIMSTLLDPMWAPSIIII